MATFSNVPVQQCKLFFYYKLDSRFYWREYVKKAFDDFREGLVDWF